MEYPVSIQFEISERCNHNCFYCYNHFRERPISYNPNLRKVIERIAESDIFHVTITGGEPFLAKDDLFYAMDCFNDSNMDVYINTNLTVFTREDLISLKNKGLLSILTSAGSSEERIYEIITGIPGSFSKFLNGLQSCSELNLTTSVNMVVNHLNKKKVYQTGRFFADNYPIKSFCATPVIPQKNKKDENLLLSKEEYIHILNELLRLEEDTGISVESLHPPVHCLFKSPIEYLHFLNRCCAAGRSTLTISPEGDVRPCSHSDKVYGNILEKELRNIFDKMDDWRGKKFVPPECEECTEIDKCRGGCRICAEAIYEDISKPNPYMGNPIKTILPFPTKKRVSLEKRIFLRPGKYRYREHKDKYTIYQGIKSFIILGEGSFNLFRYVKANTGKTGLELSRELGISETKVEQFLNDLKDSNLLI